MVVCPSNACPCESGVLREEITHSFAPQDVITFQGRSIDELKQALADSVEDYLEFCVPKGKIPEKPYSGRFNVRITPEVHQPIALEAARDGISINSWVARALSAATKQHI